MHVYGQDHALNHSDIPLVMNTGFLVEGELFHPGDSFTVPKNRSGRCWCRSPAPG